MNSLYSSIDCSANVINMKFDQFSIHSYAPTYWACLILSWNFEFIHVYINQSALSYGNTIQPLLYNICFLCISEWIRLDEREREKERVTNCSWIDVCYNIYFHRKYNILLSRVSRTYAQRNAVARGCYKYSKYPPKNPRHLPHLIIAYTFYLTREPCSRVIWMLETHLLSLWVILHHAFIKTTIANREFMNANTYTYARTQIHHHISNHGNNCGLILHSMGSIETDTMLHINTHHRYMVVYSI